MKRFEDYKLQNLSEKVDLNSDVFVIDHIQIKGSAVLNIKLDFYEKNKKNVNTFFTMFCSDPKETPTHLKGFINLNEITKVGVQSAFKKAFNINVSIK
jgi:hypothetical protein